MRCLAPRQRCLAPAFLVLRRCLTPLQRCLTPAFLVLALLLTASCGGGGDEPAALPEGRSIAVSRSLTPLVHLFGDPVVARVDMIVDTERYDPERLTIVPKFEPFELDGDPRRSMRDLGRYAHIRWDFTYRCVVYECLEEVGGGPPQILPGGIPPPNTGTGGFADRKTFQIADAQVVYDDPEDGKQVIRQIAWPRIQNSSRLNMGDTNVTGIGFPFETSVTPVPAATYRVAPGALAGGLLLAAVLLLALPAVLVVRALRRKPPPLEEPEPELTPLERALRLVEWSRARSEAERREALEGLAYELDGSGLAGRARRLAWSPREPVPEDLDALVASVKEGDGPSV